MDRRTEPVRFIVIGAGQRGGDVYAAYALDNPQDAVVVGVAEPRGDRREALAAAHAIPKENVYEDWRALLERGRFADAVIVLSALAMDQLRSLAASVPSDHM